MESDLNRFGLIAGVMATLAAATSTGAAQHVSPTPGANAKSLAAPQSPATAMHSPALPTHTLGAPARNAVGLPAATPAANTTGPMRGSGLNGANFNAANTGPVSVGGIRSVVPHAPAAPLTARGSLNGSQMGRPATGAAVLGGGATHAPNAVIGHNVSAKH
jgi:hypothetical protein